MPAPFDAQYAANEAGCTQMLSAVVGVAGDGGGGGDDNNISPPLEMDRLKIVIETFRVRERGIAE